MNLYTIGFTQKRAETFFRLLRQPGVKRLIDIRLNPDGQLAGFTKQADLPYFLRHLADGCDYAWLPDLAPTQEILSAYRDDKNWRHYVERFEALLDARNIPASLDAAQFVDACLLCSEPTAAQCHRRLVAERLARHWPEVAIVHL
jgi:uncharacterized protein (DUF488 family)